MHTDFFLDVFDCYKNDRAIIWNNEASDYHSLTKKIKYWIREIVNLNIEKGSVVVLEGDFSPNSISLMLALIEKECIIVPISVSSKKNEKKLFQIAQEEYTFTLGNDDKVKYTQIGVRENNELYNILREKQHPGLVLFSSGTSGEPKAAVHDFCQLLEKFKIKRKAMRTLNFLLFDHWGGLNTMLHIISNGGVVITSKNRAPDIICHLIEKHQIELLPTSPTFLNLLILSEAYKIYNLTSLKIISYGTEPMPIVTLKKLQTIFPNVKLLQTYGLIELGVMRSKSEKNDSLWVKVGGEGFETRIIDGILQIKAKSAMLGYLNSNSPFTKDGWFITGDFVQQKGDYIKILGRKSEIINVGGDKVYPTEVENIILEADNVAEVTVYGEKNIIVGNIVCAKIRLIKDEDKKDFILRIKQYCSQRLQNFKVPVKIDIVLENLYGNRLKKKRNYSR